MGLTRSDSKKCLIAGIAGIAGGGGEQKWGLCMHLHEYIRVYCLRGIHLYIDLLPYTPKCNDMSEFDVYLSAIRTLSFERNIGTISQTK